MQECNLMEAQAQKLSLLFSSYAADSKVESAQLDEDLLGALTGGAIGTGIGALAGNIAGHSIEDKVNTDIDDVSKAGTEELNDKIDNCAAKLKDKAHEFTVPIDNNGTVNIASKDIPVGNGTIKADVDISVGAQAFGDKPITGRVDNVIDTSTQEIKDKGNKYISSIADKAKSKVAGYKLPTTLGTAGAAIGGVTGAAVGHAVTTDDDKKRQQQAASKDGSTIAAESMKVYEMFRAAVDEEEQASNAKKAGYSAAGAFLGTAAGGPMSGALGALAGGAAGAAMTNTDGEQKSQQLGKAVGAGVGGAVGAALTGGSLAGTAGGGGAGAILGDTVGKMAGNRHSKPTPVRNRKKPSKPKP